jgi:hypothetical protein
MGAALSPSKCLQTFNRLHSAVSQEINKNLLFFPLGWSGIESTIINSTTGLLYLPWMMISVGQSVECLAVETEVPRENLPQCSFVHHKSHMT